MDWKLISEIPGYEDFTNYELNITGDLRNRKTGRILTWSLDSHGYHKVIVKQNSVSKSIKKHIVLCKLFLPNPYGKPCIDHIDRNRLNNSIDNLRWATYSENNQNKSVRADNSTGTQNIHKTIHHGKCVWCIQIQSNGKQYYKRFPRDPTSDEIPQDVIVKRDEMKRELHPLSSSI
jgi:hypothetical protein